MIYTIMTAGYLSYQSRREEPVTELKKEFLRGKKLYIPIGIAAAAASLMIFTSFSMAPAAKVVSLLQLQIFIPVIGGRIFAEGSIPRKLAGSTLMVAGIILVVI
jgi:drug/metabolite transporter (DMT)-like permease